MSIACLKRPGREPTRLVIPMIYETSQLIMYEGDWYIFLGVARDDARVRVYDLATVVWECSKQGAADVSL